MTTAVFSQPKRPLLRPVVLAILVGMLSACGGGGGGDASTPGAGGGTGAPSGNIASYAGQYDVQTNEGTVLRITVDASGRVTSCGAAYVCEGSLTLRPDGQGATLRIAGNDGQVPVGVRVTVDGTIDASGRVTGSWSAQTSEGSSNGSVTGQKVPGSTGPTTPTNPTTPTTPTTPGAVTVASFAGKYNLRADEGTTLQFTAANDGSVRSCVGAAVYVCSGAITLDAGGQSASFSITGNDGGSPVDTTVTLSGKIDSKGNATGTYKGNSRSEGSFSGSLTGTREGGASTTTPGTTAGCSALQGTWTHATKGTWVFSGSSGKLVINSLNYGPQAVQTTEVALTSCASGTMQYKFMRLKLENTVDPTIAYNVTPGSSGELAAKVDWNKVYSSRYTISATQLTIEGDTYTKK
jgi:hypothetical protein